MSSRRHGRACVLAAIRRPETPLQTPPIPAVRRKGAFVARNGRIHHRRNLLPQLVFRPASWPILYRIPLQLRLMHAFVKRFPPFQAVLLDKGVHYRRKAEARRFFWRYRSAHVRERLANRNVEQLCDIARCDGPVRRARVSPCRGGFGRRIRLFLAANPGIRRTAKMPGPRMTPGSDLALRSPERAHVNIGSDSELGDPAHSRPDAHAHPPAQRRSNIPKP